MVDANPIDFDVSADDAEAALREFDMESSTMKMRIVRAAATEEFYEIKEEYTDREVPDGTFRNAEVVELYDYARDSREYVRDGLNALTGEHGVLHRVRDAPNDPDTHYFFTDNFQETLEDTSAAEIETPEPNEEPPEEIELSYYDSTLSVGPGDHLQLMASGLQSLVPKLIHNTTENAELVYQEVDEDDPTSTISAGVVSMEFGEYELELREVIPDVVVFDHDSPTLFILESVVSEGVVDDQRVSNIKGMAENQLEDKQLNICFVTMFQSDEEYRKYADKIGTQTHVWVSADEDSIRTHLKQTFGEEDDQLCRHSVEAEDS